MAEIEGTARNAKGGAVIVGADGSPIYITGLDAWPAGFEGKRVRAMGTLNSRKRIPSPVIGPDGAVSAGAEGDQTVLDQAQWSLLP